MKGQDTSGRRQDSKPSKGQYKQVEVRRGGLSTVRDNGENTEQESKSQDNQESTEQDRR